MSHKFGILNINNIVIFIVTRKMRVHVNQTKKIQTQWRRQTTQKHADKEQGVIVGLIIWSDEVDIEQLKN